MLPSARPLSQFAMIPLSFSTVVRVGARATFSSATSRSASAVAVVSEAMCSLLVWSMLAVPYTRVCLKRLMPMTLPPRMWSCRPVLRYSFSSVEEMVNWRPGGSLNRVPVGLNRQSAESMPCPCSALMVGPLLPWPSSRLIAQESNSCLSVDISVSGQSASTESASAPTVGAANEVPAAFVRYSPFSSR